MAKLYVWNQTKNSLLREEWDVSFEDVIAAVEENKMIDDIVHPNSRLYPNQRMMIVNIRNYCYLVPYVEDEQKKFLKTIIPSRRATKKYLIDKEEDI